MAEAVTVRFTSEFKTPPVSVNLLSPKLVNRSTITATLPALDGATAAALYGEWGTAQVLFTASDVTSATNSLENVLYAPLYTPTVTSVTSTMCDFVSPLQLTDCRAMAVITIAGRNTWPGMG